MATNIKKSPTLKIQEEDINPWKAEESKELCGIEYPSFGLYQSVNRHTISYNPEHSEIQNKNQKPHSRQNFVDNLRKYERKKAKDMKIKRQINFIEKNRKEVEDPLLHNPPDEREMLTSHLFQNEKLKKDHQSQFQATIEPINWSLIMYYEQDKSKRKNRHTDIQAFLKHHSLKMDKIRKKQLFDENTTINIDSSSKAESDGFQKMLKLRQGLRKRNLKSASSSRNRLETTLEQNDLKFSTVQHDKLPGHKISDKRAIPQTSSSNRPKRTLECRIEVVGNTNSIVVAKKDRISQMRTIHSSQKARSHRKVLNIEGNKLSSK